MEPITAEKRFELVSKTGSLSLMTEAAKPLPEPRRSQELITILRAIQAGENPSLDGKYRFNVMLETVKQLSEPHRTAELVRVFDKQKIDSSHRARQAAKLMSEPKRSELLNQMLTFYIGKGEYDEAKQTANYLGRSLTQRQLESMLTKHINSGSYASAKQIVKLLERPMTDVELNTVFEKMKGQPWEEYVLVEVANQFSEPQRKQKLDQLLAGFLEDGNLDGVLSSVEALGRRLLPAEVEQLMKYWVDHYHYNRVCELEDRIKRLRYKRVLTNEELEILLRREILQGWAWDDKILKRLRREYTDEELAIMIGLQVQAGYHDSASAIAKKFAEPRRSEELEKILKLQIAEGVYKSVVETAGMLNRELTEAELTLMLEKQISDGTTEDAIKTAEMLLKIQ